MPKAKTSEESRFTLLRTTTDVMSHALLQIEACAAYWPEYRGDAAAVRVMAERFVGHAREVGYVVKVRI